MIQRAILNPIFAKKLLLAVAGLLVASTSLFIGRANAQIDTKPVFEVASLREVPDNGPPAALSVNPRRSGGRFTWTSPLSFFMRYAYHLPAWRISGIDRDRSFYVITATMHASATEDQVRLMLQALLAERFKIVAHREIKDLSGYALVVAKNGPKLKTANSLGEAPPLPEYLAGKSSEAFEGRVFTSGEGVGVSALTGRGVSSAQLADELSENVTAFVRDETGLTGKYYFGFRFQSLTRSSDDADAPSLFSALQQELGLRLEKQKGPVEILVVDRFQKPLEN